MDGADELPNFLKPGTVTIGTVSRSPLRRVAAFEAITEENVGDWDGALSGGPQSLDKFATILRWNPVVVLAFNRGFERLTGRFTGWAAN